MGGVSSADRAGSPSRKVVILEVGYCAVREMLSNRDHSLSVGQRAVSRSQGRQILRAAAV